MHAAMPQLYQALGHPYLAEAVMPRSLIDWSDLTLERHWQLLRASLALSGRSLTRYEHVPPLARSNTPDVHAAFLRQLAAMLPLGCIPILVTDAGSRGSWFHLVNRLGRYWAGRIHNRDMTRPAGQPARVGWKTLYAQRMQIEESFWNLKSERFGLGRWVSCSRSKQRIGVLLLTAAIASCLLRLAGEAARASHLERPYQSGTRKVRVVLSVITLARQLVRKPAVIFTCVTLHAALRYMQQYSAKPPDLRGNLKL
ncbi:MAG TPA: transposase [Paucimonas sp.]|nr:transposase [Paucimonas sp.]HJW56207.1 transposase [Burkholderiaceae bacterium]